MQASEVLIQDNVFIGAGAFILKGVTIGANSVVGAGAVVTSSVPANTIVAGNPARVVGHVRAGSNPHAVEPHVIPSLERRLDQTLPPPTME
jgi:acetyltransferase-like isoleucine patch superfamily enzyme